MEWGRVCLHCPARIILKNKVSINQRAIAVNRGFFAAALRAVISLFPGEMPDEFGYSFLMFAGTAV